MIFFVAEHNSLSIFIIYIKIMEEQHNLCEHVQTKWFVLSLPFFNNSTNFIDNRLFRIILYQRETKWDSSLRLFFPVLEQK